MPDLTPMNSLRESIASTASNYVALSLHSLLIDSLKVAWKGATGI